MIFPLPNPAPELPALRVPDEAEQVYRRQFHGSRILAAAVVGCPEMYADACAAREEWDVA